MIVDERSISIGIEKDGKFDADAIPAEIKAIELVMEGTVQEGLDELVSAARESCPNPNCCLSAIAKSDIFKHDGYDPSPYLDSSYTVDFTRIDVDCSAKAEGCSDRADALAETVISMVQRSEVATDEASEEAHKIAQAAQAKADATLNTARVKKAQETIDKANERADAIKTDGETKVQQKQGAIYTKAKKEIIASVARN